MKNQKPGVFLSIILLILLISAIVVTIYVILMPPSPSAAYTEFYILGPGGKATDYPKINLTSGESGNLTIGIVNHENKLTSYHLVVTIDGAVQTHQIVTLNNQQTMQIPFKFTAPPGSKELDFILYKLPDNNNVYHHLNLALTLPPKSVAMILND